MSGFLPSEQGRPDNTIMVACQGLTRRLVSDDAKRYQVQPDLAHTWELVMGRIMTVEGRRIFQQIPSMTAFVYAEF